MVVVGVKLRRLQRVGRLELRSTQVGRRRRRVLCHLRDILRGAFNGMGGTFTSTHKTQASPASTLKSVYVHSLAHPVPSKINPVSPVAKRVSAEPTRMNSVRGVAKFVNLVDTTINQDVQPIAKCVKAVGTPASATLQRALTAMQDNSTSTTKYPMLIKTATLVLLVKYQHRALHFVIRAPSARTIRRTSQNCVATALQASKVKHSVHVPEKTCY